MWNFELKQDLDHWNATSILGSLFFAFLVAPQRNTKEANERESGIEVDSNGQYKVTRYT